MTTEGGILWDVVEEHLDEAEFLVEQWSAGARSARYNLPTLQKTIEQRLGAHLDALAVNGEAVAERLLWPALAADAENPPARITAAVLALLVEPGVGARDRLLQQFTSRDQRTGAGRSEAGDATDGARRRRRAIAPIVVRDGRAGGPGSAAVRAGRPPCEPRAHSDAAAGQRGSPDCCAPPCRLLRLPPPTAARTVTSSKAI